MGKTLVVYVKKSEPKNEKMTISFFVEKDMNKYESCSLSFMFFFHDLCERS